MDYCINFFGNQYGWAPYYAYPPTYIVRPNNWYAPKWNAWYQHNPHYWQTFEQKYPYWRGHRVGQRYDQNFYNKYHRGQGEGWNQGFHGVRPPGAPGPDVRKPGTTAPGYQKPPTASHGVRALVPLVLAFVREPLVLTFVNLQQLVLAIRDLEPLVLEPPVLAFINLKKLLAVRKDSRSSSPTVQDPRSLHLSDLGSF